MKMKDDGAEICEYLLEEANESGRYTFSLEFEPTKDVVLAVIMNNIG